MNVTSVKLTIFTDLGDTHSKPFQYLGQHFTNFFTHFYTSKKAQIYISNKNSWLTE